MWYENNIGQSIPRPRFRGGREFVGKSVPSSGPCLRVSVEAIYADLLICVCLRNSYRRRRQYPATRSIGLYWEGQVVRVLVLSGTGSTGSEQSVVPLRSCHERFMSVSQEEWDMVQFICFSARH
jgi:hypothetical protein